MVNNVVNSKEGETLMEHFEKTVETCTKATARNQETERRSIDRVGREQYLMDQEMDALVELGQLEKLLDENLKWHGERVITLNEVARATLNEAAEGWATVQDLIAILQGLFAVTEEAAFADAARRQTS